MLILLWVVINSFKQHNDILKSINKIAKSFDCMSHNMTFEVLNFHADIQRIKVNVETHDNFKSFCERKRIFEGDDD